MIIPLLCERATLPMFWIALSAPDGLTFVSSPGSSLRYRTSPTLNAVVSTPANSP